MYYLPKKDFVQCPADMTRHTAELQPYKTPIDTPHIILLPAANAMSTSRQPATKKMRALKQPLLPDASSDICPYSSASPAFDPQIVLLGRLFFINSDRTNYVSDGFYPALDYQPLV